MSDMLRKLGVKTHLDERIGLEFIDFPRTLGTDTIEVLSSLISNPQFEDSQLLESDQEESL